MTQIGIEEQNDKIKRAKKEFYNENGETFECYIFLKLTKIDSKEYEVLHVKILKWQIETKADIHSTDMKELPSRKCYYKPVANIMPKSAAVKPVFDEPRRSDRIKQLNLEPRRSQRIKDLMQK